MKTVQVTPAAKSYGAFEMKEYIGKSTLKSFGMTMGLMVLIPLVFLATKASINPTPPYVQPPTYVILKPQATHEIKKKVDKVITSTGCKGFKHEKIKGYVPIPVKDTLQPQVIGKVTEQVNNPVYHNGGRNTKDIPPTAEVTKPSEIEVIDDDTVIETESDPILDYAQLQSNLVYPEMAKRIDIEGKVLVRVVVGKDGKPVSGRIRILESTNELFNQTAIDAVMKSSFTPAIQNKQPIEVPVTVPIVFRLR
ncbi:MAG: TonB family protein [Ignavibacteriae bacterium]|nr:TonB family protein [Ignavibacteriota bacterium]